MDKKITKEQIDRFRKKNRINTWKTDEDIKKLIKLKRKLYR